MSKKDDEIIELLDSFNNQLAETTRHQAAFIICQEKNDIEQMKQCLDGYDTELAKLLNMKNTLSQICETIRNDGMHYSKSTIKEVVNCIDTLIESTAPFELFSRIAHKNF